MSGWERPLTTLDIAAMPLPRRIRLRSRIIAYEPILLFPISPSWWSKITKEVLSRCFSQVDAVWAG